MKFNANNFNKLAQLLLLTLLVSCGGGGSGGDSLLPNSDGNTPSTDTPSTDTPITHSAIVEWDIPSTRENGDDLLLSEIGGYEIIYQKTTDDLSVTEVVTDQTQNQLVLNDLTTGTYQVRIAAFDTNGLYSDYSDPAYADIGN
ncbi:fibronectin type III domain-containing protein [Teredinibacter haidensis]|uniref:fibronectin type III domain-containing protein n=1 Tax=Teredinibacter haidensis TaxID=2731755 RepID=UPI0009488BB6|nr:fibronectin type III domain-containing protein [Teredinibacter haidensis]